MNLLRVFYLKKNLKKSEKISKKINIWGVLLTNFGV